MGERSTIQLPIDTTLCDKRIMQVQEKIHAFVDRNSGYYKKKWQHFEDGSKFSFNWAACLLQIFWLAYRKLYLATFVTFLIYCLYVALWMYVDEQQLLTPNLLTAFEIVGAVAFYVCFGLLGNYLYWRKFQRAKRIAEVSFGDVDAQYEFLRKKGGTNAVVAWIVVILFMLPVLWAGYWGIYVAGQLRDSGYIFDATGPLTLAEFEANYLVHLDEPLEGSQRECVFREIEARAAAAGDPETLDPSTVDFLPKDAWPDLDPDGRRIILMQVITTKAMFECPYFDE